MRHEAFQISENSRNTWEHPIRKPTGNREVSYAYIHMHGAWDCRKIYSCAVHWYMAGARDELARQSGERAFPLQLWIREEHRRGRHIYRKYKLEYHHTRTLERAIIPIL